MVKTMGKTVIAVVVIIVIAVGAFSISGTQIPFRAGTGGTTTVGQITETQPMVSTTGQTYNGQLTVTNDAIDSNDPTITYTGVSDYDVICYERIGDDVRSWEVLDTGDDSATESMTIPIRKTTTTDRGVTEMWCGIDRETAGTDVYIDKDGITRANDRVDTCIYDDANLDQTPEWICRVNLLDIAPNADPNNIPSLTLRLKFMEEATTASLDSTTASIINIGTGTNANNRIKWNVDFDTSSPQNDAGAKALSQIQLRTNTTDDDFYDVNNSYIEVPNGANIQRIKFSQMDEIPQTSQVIYKWKYDQTTGQRDVASANLIVVPKGGDPEVDLPTIVSTRFTALANAFCLELELEYVDAFNVFTTTSDDAELVADSTNGDECTL